MTLNGKKFSIDKSFIVPLDQEKFKVIQAIFNTQKKFKDSTFYDVSSWTIPLAFDVNYEKISDMNFIGKVIEGEQKIITKNLKKADYAYIFESHGYFYPF